MKRGYYKAWRRITDTMAWSLGLEYRGLMHSILVRTNHKPQIFRGYGVPVGSLAVVVSKWCEELGLTRQKLQRMLHKLESKPDEFIKIQNVGNRFLIIKVLNWHLYQSPPKDERATDVTTNNTTDNTTDVTTTVTTEQEDKNNNTKNPPISPLEGGEAFRLSELLFSLIQQNNPKAKKPNFKTWARTMDRMIRLDGRTTADLEEVIKWCQANEFWHTNILSVAKLRKQFDQLWLKMRGSKPQYSKHEADLTANKIKTEQKMLQEEVARQATQERQRQIRAAWDKLNEEVQQHFIQAAVDSKPFVATIYQKNPTAPAVIQAGMVEFAKTLEQANAEALA